MTAYFDTSAFLKLFIVEPGSATVATAWNGADMLATCRLMYAEARAALAAARRQGRVSVQGLAWAKKSLKQHWGDLDVWECVEPIVEHAGDLAEQHALRGYDAVHLATALAASADLFVTADEDLLRAGPACGLPVIDARR